MNSNVFAVTAGAVVIAAFIYLAAKGRIPRPAAETPPRPAPRACPGLEDDGYPLDSVEQDQLDAIEDALRADADPIRLGADYWTKGWKP